MLLADQCWLVAHDDTTGRPLLPPRLAGVALSSAILAELLCAGLLTLRPDGPVITASSPPADPLQRATLEKMARERHSLSSWLRFLARDASDSVAQRLTFAGVLEARSSRSMLGKARRQYMPRNSAEAAWPRVRLAKLLSRNQPAEGNDVALAAWTDATGLARHVLWDDAEGVGKRYLEHLVSYTPADVRTLYSATNTLMNQLMLG